MHCIEKEIRLGELAEVRDFVVLASKYKCHVKVTSENSETDGRSILGMLSLKLWQPVTVSAFGEDAKEFAAGLKQFNTQ